jgi:hypothetical protein
MAEVSRAESVKATIRLLDRQGKLPPKPEGFEDILDNLAVSIDPHQSLHAMPVLAQAFGTVISQLSFEVVHNKTDVSFLTSDNPVIYFNPTVYEEKVLPYQVRPPHGSIELLFPIDPETVLRGQTGLPGMHHIAFSDRRAVKRINRFVARFGYRFVFARDSSHAPLIGKYARTSPVLKTVTLPTPTGGTLIFSECVFGPRPIKPKWVRPSSDDFSESDPDLTIRSGAI